MCYFRAKIKYMFYKKDTERASIRVKWGMINIILLKGHKEVQQKQSKSSWLRNFLIDLGKVTGYGLNSYWG